MGETTTPSRGEGASGERAAGADVVGAAGVKDVKPKKQLHNRRRFWLLLAFGAVVLYWLVTRSPLTRWVVVRQIEKATGLEVRGGSVALNPSGAFSLKSMTLAVPGVRGAGGEVIGWDDLTGTLDFKRLVGIKKTGPLVRTVEALHPFVRFSQASSNGVFSVTLVRPPVMTAGGSGAGAGGDAFEPPRLRVIDGRIELGEHDEPAGKYTLLRSIPFQGWMRPAPGEKPGTQLLALWESESEMGPPAPSRGLDLRGQVGPDGFTLAFGGLAVKDWPARDVPSRFREVYESLGLDGVVRDVQIDYLAPTSTVRASMMLNDVAVNLPIGEDGRPVRAGERPLRMSKTSGEIRFENAGGASGGGGTVSADLSGLIEDFPFRAKLTYLGTTLEAPFSLVLESEGFQLRERPELLRFAAPTVKQRLGQFNNPTGIVNTTLTVERAGGRGSEVRATGEMRFHDAVAAFDRFPYEFRDLTGHVRFTENSLEIVELAGRAPSGATISAKGTIAPLTDAAKVDLRVEVNNAPIDETLARAMGRSRRVLDELFSVEHHAKLVRAGLVRSGPEGEAPGFELGGRFDVILDIHRPEGMEVEWDQTIDVRMKDVNVLPARFPLPLVTRGINIWMDTKTITLRGGTWRGLAGGEFSATATMPYDALSGEGGEFVPDVRVTGAGIPFNAHLAHAAAEAAGRGGSVGADGVPVSEWLERALLALRLSGSCDAAVHITDRGQGVAGVDAGVSFSGASAEPRGSGEPRPFALDNLSGVITLSDEWLNLQIDAAHESAAVRASASVAIGGQGRGWSASIDTESLELSEPFESIVDAFSPKAAGALGEARARLQPRGSVLLGVRLSGDEATTDSLIDLRPLRDASLVAFNGRLGVGPSSGAIRILNSNDQPTIIEFERFTAPLTFDARDMGRAELSGAFRGGGEGLTPAGDARVVLTSTPFECGPVSWFVRERLGQEAADLYNAVGPRGVFDLQTELGPREDGSVWADGWLRPHELSIRVNERIAELTDLSGELRFLRDGRGSIRRLEGRSAREGEQYTFAIDGGWSSAAGGAFSLGADLTLNSIGIPASLLTFMPPAVGAALETMEVRVDGPVRLGNARLRVERRASALAPGVSFDGVVDFAGARFMAGREITECEGQLSITAQSPPDVPAGFELRASMPRLRASNILLTDASVTAVSAPDGRIVIPSIVADCYGGRVFGDATITPAPAGTEFVSNTWLSGVRFAPTLRDLTAVVAPDALVGPPRPGTPDQPVTPIPESAPDAGPDADNPNADSSRGVLEGWFGLAGTLNKPETRRGRGEVTIGGGSVVQLPLVMPLISFSNLQLPGDEPLDHATASFYFQGATIVFESMTASSRSVQLYGYGTATTPELALDMRFNSRSLRRIPMVTALIEGFRDQLIGTTVGGTLARPKVDAVALPRAGSIFAQIFGLSNKEQETRLSDIEVRLKRDIDRTRTLPDRSR
ncbi:MAG: hypothetical protein JNL50_03165 [Phycisphaerae bacterium]|nr:hypothetical protein [Phycisphaerae bacterium]